MTVGDHFIWVNFSNKSKFKMHIDLTKYYNIISIYRIPLYCGGKMKTKKKCDIVYGDNSGMII